MTSTSVLVRPSDGKRFRVRYLAHWSVIISEDNKERDTVKWLWDRQYVSVGGVGYEEVER